MLKECKIAGVCDTKSWLYYFMGVRKERKKEKAIEHKGEEEGMYKLKMIPWSKEYKIKIPWPILNNLCFFHYALPPEAIPSFYELSRLVSKTLTYGNLGDTYSSCSSLHLVSLKIMSTKYVTPIFLFLCWKNFLYIQILCQTYNLCGCSSFLWTLNWFMIYFFIQMILPDFKMSFIILLFFYFDRSNLSEIRISHVFLRIVLF